MVETVIGLLTTVAICYLILWIASKITVPTQFQWVVTSVIALLLLFWVLERYSVLSSLPKVAGQ